VAEPHPGAFLAVQKRNQTTIVRLRRSISNQECPGAGRRLENCTVRREGDPPPATIATVF